ncbi:unnamed protein product [Effrenium voratum]|nr:unnamed protein product [Effrenium voratum]
MLAPGKPSSFRIPDVNKHATVIMSHVAWQNEVRPFQSNHFRGVKHSCKTQQNNADPSGPIPQKAKCHSCSQSDCRKDRSALPRLMDLPLAIDLPRNRHERLACRELVLGSSDCIHQQIPRTPGLEKVHPICLKSPR